MIQQFYWLFIKKKLNHYLIEIYMPMSIAALFTIPKELKELKCPQMNEWIKKIWCIRQWNIILIIKKKEILPFMITWMNEEGNYAK